MSVTNYLYDFVVNDAQLGIRCAICMEFFRREQRACNLRCTHKFHKTCVTRWLMTQAKKTCPVCREPIGNGRIDPRPWMQDPLARMQDPRVRPAQPRTPQPPRRQPTPLSPYGHAGPQAYQASQPYQAPQLPRAQGYQPTVGNVHRIFRGFNDANPARTPEEAANPWDAPMTADQWIAAGGMLLGFVKSVIPPAVTERIGDLLTTPIVKLLEKNEDKKDGDK